MYKESGGVLTIKYDIRIVMEKSLKQRNTEGFPFDFLFYVSN